MAGRAERFHRLLVDVDEDHGCGDLPEEQCRAVPGNTLRIVAAHTLQSIGDRVVDAKTVLPWLLEGLGAPAAMAGLLVPLRESGSLLPQAPLVPVVRRRSLRKWVWVAGGTGQVFAVAAMALAAATGSGAAAGAAVLVALSAFAVARSLSSIASKDVLGRTVPKGQRGQVSGLATVTSGAVAVTLGLAIRVRGDGEAAAGALAALLGGAALAWVAAAAMYATVREAPGGEDLALDAGWLAHALRLLRADAPFRRFVIVRSLLLVSALSPPFVVTLAARETGTGLAHLGPFLVASGLAGLFGGRVLGRLADWSSRTVMVLGAGTASAAIFAVLAVRSVPAPSSSEAIGSVLSAAWWPYPLVYLVLALAHTGVRVARKTYIVDLASGNRRTDYVAVSNTAMGVLLLATGAVSSALAQVGVEAALAFLAALGLGRRRRGPLPAGGQQVATATAPPRRPATGRSRACGWPRRRRLRR